MNCPGRNSPVGELLVRVFQPRRFETGTVNDVAQNGDGYLFIVVPNPSLAFLKADPRLLHSRSFFQSLLDRAGAAFSSHPCDANDNRAGGGVSQASAGANESERQSADKSPSGHTHLSFAGAGWLSNLSVFDASINLRNRAAIRIPGLFD
jgi:hypothetical protein